MFYTQGEFSRAVHATARDWLLRFVPVRPRPLLFTLLHLLEFGAWRRATGFDDLIRLTDREELFAHVHRLVPSGEPIDYLEFGVWRGQSISRWAALNRHPASRFVGFDSFYGLPQQWSQLGCRFA